jgi:nitroreductase
MDKTEITLPPPQLKGRSTLEETIAKRRSVRAYRAEALTLSQLSQILWAAQGLTGGETLKTAPSAGATYPLEIFVFTGKRGITSSEAQRTLGEIPAGICHYEPHSHSLSLHKPGDSTSDLARAAVNQEFVLEAPWTLSSAPSIIGPVTGMADVENDTLTWRLDTWVRIPICKL